MNTSYVKISLTVILALSFDFINGFHDTANAIATAVSTKALSPRRVIIIASLMNFLGTIAFTGVAKTIAKDIVNLNAIPNGL
jgi:PiT family inorganic phosphate transporter